VSIRRKYGVSLFAFGVLALLAWLTLSNDPFVVHESTFGAFVHIHFRTAVLAVLALLAFMTTVAFWRATIEERREADSHQEQARF
jgi:hypothetical protein